MSKQVNNLSNAEIEDALCEAASQLQDKLIDVHAYLNEDDIIESRDPNKLKALKNAQAKVEEIIDILDIRQVIEKWNTPYAQK